MDTLKTVLLDTPVFATQAPFYANNVLFSTIVLAGINLLNVIPKNFSPFSEGELEDNEKVVNPFNRFFVVLLIASVIGYTFSYMNAVGRPGSFLRTASSGVPGVALFTGVLSLAVYQISLFTADVEQKNQLRKPTKTWVSLWYLFSFCLLSFLGLDQ